MELNPPPRMIGQFTSVWRDWLNQVYEKLRGPLWEDVLAPLANAQTRGTAPTLGPFGPSSITQQYEFNRLDGMQVEFHIPHNIKPGSKVYPHVHWSTDGVGSGVVEWNLEYSLAKGHNQEAFTAQTAITVSQTASGTAWQHMITEVSDAQAFDAPEPDSLILMKVSRHNVLDTYPNTGTGGVFGLFVDLHYQIDRLGTPGKAPDFYKY